MSQRSAELPKLRAMVLCAGLGTRLRPVTEVWPKPAIPLLGQPLFRYALGSLKSAGVTEVGINTFHLPQVMEETARTECAWHGFSLTVSPEEGEIQGTGGGIRGLRAFLQDGDFIVFNGDILFEVDLAQAVLAHRKSGAAATMVLLPMPKDEKYAAVEVDSAFSVRRIAGKGPGGERLSNWHFSGVHVMSPAVFDFMKPSGAEDINREVYIRLLEKGLRIHGHVAKGYWSDLGTPQRYLATHQDLLFGQVPLNSFGDLSPFARAPRGAFQSWYHRTSKVEGKVSGPAYFDAGARVQPGGRIGAAVSLGPDTLVADGARLNRVALLRGEAVGELQDALVFDGTAVQLGA